MIDNEKAARQKMISHTIMFIVLIVLFFCFIFPFLMVIVNVLKTKADITADPLGLIGEHGFILDNFRCPSFPCTADCWACSTTGPP